MKLGGGKVWFTAAELAELALPGLSKSKRKINERALAEGWALRSGADGTPLARPRAGQRGGGLEYHIDLIPAAARAALVKLGVAAVAHVAAEPGTRAEVQWQLFDAASDDAKAKAQIRLGAIAMVDAYEAVLGGRDAAVGCAAAEAKVGKSTLWGWLALVEGVAPADRLAFLLPSRGGGGHEAEIDPQAWQVFLSDYLRPEPSSLAECYRRTSKWAGLQGIALPGERAFRRKLERDVDQRVIVASRKGAEALRRMLPAQPRSVLDLHVMEAVNIDGHEFDVFVNWGDDAAGKPIIKRPIIVAIQDVYSRKLLAWRICETENAVDVRLAFANLFRQWGIPKHCVLDNGHAFASKWITGGAPTRYRFKVKDTDPLGLLTSLGIVTHWTTPYRGQSKPIERAWLDLTDIIARHPATHGAYTGNKPDAKPENYGKAAVPIDAFVKLVTNGIAAHNAREGRDTETARKKFSFDQVFEAGYAVAPIGKASPEQLRLALLAAEQRGCNRQTGEITLEGNRYWAPELADYRGKRVTVRFDPDNLHGEVHVYDHAGHFIATAPAIEKSGFFDTESAKRRKAREAEWRKQVRTARDLEMLLSPATLAAVLEEDTAEPFVPEPGVIRPVRHRGQTAAALKPVPEAPPAPLNPVIDRLTDVLLRVVK